MRLTSTLRALTITAGLVGAVAASGCGGKAFESPGSGAGGAGGGGTGGTAGTGGTGGEAGTGGGGSGGGGEDARPDAPVCDDLDGCARTGDGSTCFDGCNTCACGDAGWACTDLYCPPDGGVCPPVPPAFGSACSDPALHCGYTDATCACDGATWDCVPVVTEPCPDFPPETGDPCSTDGQICGKFGHCSPSCTCSPLTGWLCFPAVGCPPGACPAAPPKDGSFCDDQGVGPCEYPATPMLSCTCKPRGTWSAWTCTQ